MRREWDAIIAGGSFAGLAAATELAGSGRVLLLDPDPIGDHQTSACATPVPVLERLAATETIDQVHADLVIHLPGGRVRRYRPAYPFCTFDYRRLCRLLAARTDAEIVQARVLGVERDGVRTSAGSVGAPILIDGSGWRSVLASGRAARGRTGWLPLPARSRLPRSASARSVGLEVEVPRQGDGLHFWVGDELARDGYLWDFPAGARSRVGLLRYRSGGGLKQRLQRFLDRVPLTEPHGGVLPAGLRPPAAGYVFFAGDAAGLCLPLTGEGIRPALLSGQLAGWLAARVLTRGLVLPDALSAYSRLLTGPALMLKYGLLSAIERTMHMLPEAVLDLTSWHFGAGPLAARCQAAYWRVAPAEWLRPHAPTGEISSRALRSRPSVLGCTAAQKPASGEVLPVE